MQNNVYYSFNYICKMADKSTDMFIWQNQNLLNFQVFSTNT